MLQRVTKGIVIVAALVAGCASTPRTQSKRTQLQRDAHETVQAMLGKDPTLQPLLDRSAGYVVFPSVKEGGFIVGGAGAEGVVFGAGRPIAFAELSRASFGAQIGGQKYAELIVVRDRYTLDKMRAGNVDFGAQASAVILRAGAATRTDFGANGIAVVIDPIGGAMVNASVSGQRIKVTM
jgi:lipid-binding SYLF domain-containing protein